MSWHLRSIHCVCAALLLSAACGDDVGSADNGEETGSSGSTTAPTTMDSSVTDPTVADASESSGTPTSTATTESSTATETTETTATETTESTESTDTTATDTTESSDESSSDSGSSSETTTDTGTPACDCGPDEYCDFPDNDCGAGQDAICTSLPEICDLIFAPVCGCDGRTYGNDCEAAAAGVDVDYEGECDGGNACECGPDEYCDWPDDQCGMGEEGDCVVIPEACLDIYDPVCGCDGQTHSNDCYAAAAGVDVAYAGEC